MLILYNESLMINHPIGTSSVCGFQLSNKKEFILCLFELPIVDPLTLTIVLLLFNLFIIITSQSSLQHQYHFIICNLYSSPPCGSTPILPGYLLFRHSCTWDKTSTLWSCQVFGAVAGEVSYCINYIFSFILFYFHFYSFF
jgi:hypothetical protein